MRAPAGGQRRSTAIRGMVGIDSPQYAAAELFKSLFGDDSVHDMPPEMGGEDFSRFARRLEVPGLQFRIGTVSAEAVAASKRPGAAPLPSVHSSKFAPIPEPTLRTAVTAMSNLALALLTDK